MATHQVRLLTVGYVADRFEGNTGGNSAAIALFKVAGVPVPSPFSPLFSLASWASNNLLGSSAKTASPPADVPAWWPHAERGAEGAP